MVKPSGLLNGLVRAGGTIDGCAPRTAVVGSPSLRKRFPHLTGNRREDLAFVGVVLGVGHEDAFAAVGQFHVGCVMTGLAGPAGLAQSVP